MDAEGPSDDRTWTRNPPKERHAPHRPSEDNIWVVIAVFGLEASEDDDGRSFPCGMSPMRRLDRYWKNKVSPME